MHQLFPSRRRDTQAPTDSASQPAVPGLEMERRELAEVESDYDEDYGWVHFDDHEQLGNSQFSKASATESTLNEKSNEDSRKPDKGTASHDPDDVEEPHGSTAAQDPQESPIEGPSADHVTKSNYQDLLASIAKDRAELEHEMQEFESARTYFSEHIQSLEQALRERGNQEAHTLKEAEQNFKKQLQAQSQELNDLSLKLQSQQGQHEKQTHAALEGVSQKTQGQNTFVLEKIRADLSVELSQLRDNISAVELALHSTIDQRLATQADAMELALDHERSVRKHEQGRLAEELKSQKASTEHEMQTALEVERVQSEQAMAKLQQTMSAEIEAEVEHINDNIGDALRSLKAEMDGKRDALAANIDNAFDECKRMEKALQTEASKQNTDIQVLQVCLKEAEQPHAKDVLVLKELLDKYRRNSQS